MERSPAIALSLAGSLAALICGCASPRVDLRDRVQVEERTPVTMRVAGVGVYEQDGALLVHGTIEREYKAAGIARGHVDVAVVSPDGKLLDQSTSLLFPRDIPTRKPRVSSFTVRLPVVPPEGSTVRVAYVAGSHESCGETARQ